MRALERAGYAIVDTPTPTQVRVQNGTAQTSWLIEADTEIRCDSIECVIDELAACGLHEASQ